MRHETSPAVCPRCRSSNTVRLIWNCNYLFGVDEQDVNAGRAIPVSLLTGHSYEPWQALMEHRAGDLPPRACLDCNPGWGDVCEMAMQDFRRQQDKEDAIVAQQFDRAAAVRDAQYLDRGRFVAEVARMLGESDPTG